MRFWRLVGRSALYSPEVYDEDTSLQLVTIHQRSADAEPALDVVVGSAKGERSWLRESELVLGRDEEVPLRFTERGVSRCHAKFIRASDGIVSVLDLGSTNGTFVNGKRVDLAVLREGDRIQVGPLLVLHFAYQIPEPDKRPAALPLSARQLEIARLVARGLTSAAIADALGIRTRTVTSHLEHIYDRLAISSRATLTRLIVEAGLLDDHE